MEGVKILHKNRVEHASERITTRQGGDFYANDFWLCKFFKRKHVKCREKKSGKDKCRE